MDLELRICCLKAVLGSLMQTYHGDMWSWDLNGLDWDLLIFGSFLLVFIIEES